MDFEKLESEEMDNKNDKEGKTYIFNITKESSVQIGEKNTMVLSTREANFETQLLRLTRSMLVQLSEMKRSISHLEVNVCGNKHSKKPKKSERDDCHTHDTDIEEWIGDRETEEEGEEEGSSDAEEECSYSDGGSSDAEEGGYSDETDAEEEGGYSDEGEADAEEEGGYSDEGEADAEKEGDYSDEGEADAKEEGGYSDEGQADAEEEGGYSDEGGEDDEADPENNDVRHRSSLDD